MGEKHTMKKETLFIGLVAALGGFAIGQLTAGSSGSEEGASAENGDLPADDVERFKVEVTPRMPSTGPDTALVTIVEVSDFECPFCKRVLPTVDRIKKEYGNDVRVVWANNPLPFHSKAKPAAEAALEAYAQGGSEKFWKMHDKLFENQKALGRNDLEKYAKSLDLDLTKFRRALDSHTHAKSIAADQAMAARFDARGTPAFFINGRKLMGAQPYDKFKEIIDEEIRHAKAVLATGVSKAKLYAQLISNAQTKAERPKPSEPAAQQQRPDPDAVYKVPVDDEPSWGPNDALVTIVEFSDFECPFCSRVEPTLLELKKKYGRDLRLVWMNNPLPFHKNANPAAQAALEAHSQGGDTKFWKMHEKLFANQKALARSDLEKYAKEIGLNMAKFKKALDSQAHQKAISAQQQLAQSLGASGTPSFFINGRNLRGAQPLGRFVETIDAELKKAKELVANGTPRSQVYDTIIADGATKQQFLAAGGDAEEPSNYKIPLPAKVPAKGPKSARATIQIFSDFQCPFCSRVLPTLKQVEKEYGDKVRVVWRNFPLPFHKQAMLAHEAAWEVYEQKGSDKFWQFHDLLFANQRALERSDLESYAQRLGGIDMARFRKALDDHRHKARIEEDKAAISKAGARIGTPSFFINGELLQGAQPYDAFKAAIDRALS